MRYTNRRASLRPAAVLPLVTICLVGLFGFVALAIDIGMMAVARTQSQSAADAGALAGARTLNGKSGNNRTAAEAEASEAAQANVVLNSQVTAAQVTTVRSGVYRYNTTSQRFVAEFGSAPTSLEAYGVMQVVITTQQPTYFGRVLGVNSMQVGAQATAVHRPRDVAISLDFSGSMKFSSEYNYPPISGSTQVTGTLNGDDRFPQFGPWKIFPTGSTTPMRFTGSSFIDSGGEVHARNNMTITTPHGPPIVHNFQTNAAAAGTNAFVYNGDLSAGSFSITNSPVCTPTPSTWTSQYATSYAGDRWPIKLGTSTTAPTAAQYAKHVGDVAYNPVPAITNSTRNASWETVGAAGGYDMSTLTFKNTGTFKGYSVGPGYFGKSFYVWPPDPRWTTGADPTNINTSNPILDTTSRYMADWRKRFFLYPSTASGTKGAIMDDNSRLWDTTTGRWRAQGIGGTVQYVPNYDAILKWLIDGPKTLPSALRAGRVLYYDQIPTSMPMNWQTGVISASADQNQRFWKEYIDFVLGAGRHNRGQTLYGDSTTNTYGADTFGTPKITAKASLTGTPAPYMNYLDCPVHPRLHTWFGPSTMLGFLSVNSNNLDYNWMAGTTSEAQCWQLKAGIRSALDDVRNNHPNDLATLNFWSSHNGYNTSRVAMGKDYDKMQNCLYYPFSLINSLGTATSEKRPYKDATPATANPSGLDPANYASDIPLADGGTNPSMGLMLSYNQFNWVNTYTGRSGATKMVILETDGVANQKINGTFSSITSGRKEWTSITNGGSAPSPSNGHPDALNPAISLAWLLCQDSTGSKVWPTFPAYTNGSGVASAGAPAKWTGITSNGPGFSTARNPARVHTIGFGELFEPANSSGVRTRALEFLRNVQIAGGTSAADATSIESYKIITGTSTERIDKLKQALERIMQGGIQVALIE